MNMNIHCPGCQAALHVPRDAGGRAARCPKCQCKFIIPSATELIEETVSQWIVEDLEHSDEDGRPHGQETLLGVVADHAVHQGGADGPDGHPSGSATVAQGPPVQIPVQERSAPSAAPIAAAAPRAAVDAGRASPSAEPARVAEPAMVHASTQSRYPGALATLAPQPHLIVRDCSQSGVVLAFEPRWLEHEGFCCSMPVRCAFSGASTRGDLIARPMVFLERYRGADRSPRSVESRHERYLTVPQAPRDLLKAMGHIDNMIPPFQNIVIYYASKHHTTQSMHCRTAVLADGVNACEVTIPDGRVALEWLGHVNGICGDDYEMLRADVAMLGSDAWRALSEKCREHLAVWCRFQAREQFRLYVNDADFGAHDAGLAGVVITDHRLVFHKYHHGGSIELDEDATLHVKTDGQVARLTYDCKGQLARVGKIHIKDMSRLIEALADSPGLRIQLAAAARR